MSRTLLVRTAGETARAGTAGDGPSPSPPGAAVAAGGYETRRLLPAFPDFAWTTEESYTLDLSDPAFPTLVAVRRTRDRRVASEETHWLRLDPAAMSPAVELETAAIETPQASVLSGPSEFHCVRLSAREGEAVRRRSLYVTTAGESVLTRTGELMLERFSIVFRDAAAARRARAELAAWILAAQPEADEADANEPGARPWACPKAG